MAVGVAEPIGETLSVSREVKKKGKKMGGVTRFHVSFPESLHERLVEIQNETHATSLTDVLKDSLKIYAFLLDAHKNGREVIVRGKENGKEVSIPLFL